MRNDPNTDETRANQDGSSAEPQRCIPLKSFCKRGHRKTEAMTFERVITVKGKKYIARECRACHSIRNRAARARQKQTQTLWPEKWQCEAVVSADRLGQAVEALLRAGRASS